MRYEPHIQPLETEGFTQTKQFSIDATGKAFRNLMDGLYSRKIEAVVREICTNAYDSHIKAGYPGRKFRLTLPTYLKPFFVVRDYGTGMTHEVVMDLYSTLFRSSKDTSNLENGMLGLGSKSPFAYTDGFTLRCWDGVSRRTYSSYLGEGGVPLISLADESPSDEPRGVEVSFPVKKDDYAEFETCAIRVLKGFPALPEGINAEIQRQIVRVPTSVGDCWAMVNDYLPRSHRVWALQGCVYYPVEPEHLDDLAYELRNANFQILLDHPIGELEFTPGRETLSYTEKTVENLRKRWSTFRKEASEEFDEMFSSCKTDWEVACLANEKAASGLFNTLFRVSIYAKRTAEINQTLRYLLPRELRDAHEPEERLFTVVNREGETRRSRYRRSYRNSYPESASDQILWVERSHGVKNHWKRIANHLIKTGARYALSYAEPHADLLENDQQTLEQWIPDLASLGNPEVLKTRDLEEPPVKRTSSGTPSWERFRPATPTRNGWISFSPVSEDVIPENAEFLFMCGDKLVQPQATGQAKTWPLLNINFIEYLKKLRFFREVCGMDIPDPYIIRMKAGEVLRSWNKLRIHQPRTEEARDHLTDQHVRIIVNELNREKIADSHYGKALDRLKLELYRRPRDRNTLCSNPLWALERFTKRSSKHPSKLRERLLSYYKSLSLEHQNGVLEMALHRGLEVIPERSTTLSNAKFPYDLLPLRWENLARIIYVLPSGLSAKNAKSSDLTQLIKDALTLDRIERSSE